uniref:hypothetical protein n=1 Tax=Alicyclobacillus suci TaxID=2816080 RepID=UPI001A9070F5
MMLGDYLSRYVSIIQGKKGVDRDRALALLMTDMEREYEIPLLYNRTWVQENKAAYKLYQMI